MGLGTKRYIFWDYVRMCTYVPNFKLLKPRPPPPPPPKEKKKPIKISPRLGLKNPPLRIRLAVVSIMWLVLMTIVKDIAYSIYDIGWWIVFMVLVTNESHAAIFPFGTMSVILIITNLQHNSNVILCRPWVQVFLNEVVQ